MLFLVLLSSIFLSVIFPNQSIIEEPKIAEKIITETHFGYHNLKGVSTRQTIKMVYAPDTTPHGYPTWPYMHVYGYDTLFYESDYYVSDKGASYRDEYYLPSNIKVKKDTVLQFIKQIAFPTFNSSDMKIKTWCWCWYWCS